MCSGLWFDLLHTLPADGCVGSVVIFMRSACPGSILQSYIAIVKSPGSLYASGHK